MMKAAVIRKPHVMEIVERKVPSPGKGEVLVKVKAVGICGSDLHGFLGHSGTRRAPGLIMGHEASGIVHELGEDVHEFSVGDPIAIDPQLSCGKCSSCKNGWSNLCEHKSIIGSSMLNFKDGAMCEFICVPEENLIPLPVGLSFGEGAMVEPAGNAFRPVLRSHAAIGDTAVVYGTGVIGLMIVRALRMMGCSQIIGVDIADWKLELAKKYGADIVLNSQNCDTVEEIFARTNGLGADISVEAVGLTSTYTAAVKCLRKRGVLCALGFMEDIIGIPSQKLLFSEITILGNTGFTYESKTVIDTMATGKLDVKPIITHTFPLERVQEAFDIQTDPKNRTLKVMIEFE